MKTHRQRFTFSTLPHLRYLSMTQYRGAFEARHSARLMRLTEESASPSVANLWLVLPQIHLCVRRRARLRSVCFVETPKHITSLFHPTEKKYIHRVM